MMKLYLISFRKVDWEQDYAVLVSALDKEHALKVAEISDIKKGWNNRHKDNIQEIEEIGIYNKDIAKEIISDNKGA
jgi:hypothetical protein